MRLRDIALAFARDGAHVVVNDIDPKTADATATEVATAGVDSLAVVVVVLDLLTLATAAPRTAAQALNRSAEAVVTLERHARRSGYITSYPIRF